MLRRYHQDEAHAKKKRERFGSRWHWEVEELVWWELGPERPGRKDELLCSATRISDLKFEIAVASKESG